MKRKPKPRCAKCKVNQAALDDACRQLDDMRLKFEQADSSWMFATQSWSWANIAAEMNMSAYEDAQMHAKVQHDLLTEKISIIENLQERLKHFANRNEELWDENAALNDSVRMQRELLINYNTRGNLIHWFGEFLLDKERGRFDVVSSRLEGDHV